MLNSLHFINLLSNITLEANDVLVISYVSSLFMITSILASVAIMHDLSAHDKDDKFSDLYPLVSTYLTSTHLVFQRKVHQQTSVFPMGSPLSSIVADIIIEAFEPVALGSSP